MTTLFSIFELRGDRPLDRREGEDHRRGRGRHPRGGGGEGPHAGPPRTPREVHAPVQRLLLADPSGLPVLPRGEVRRTGGGRAMNDQEGNLKNGNTGYSCAA